jgi:hypothetical protein
MPAASKLSLSKVEITLTFFYTILALSGLNKENLYTSHERTIRRSLYYTNLFTVL